MTYEFWEDHPQQPEEAPKDTKQPPPAARGQFHPYRIGTDFDALVQKHARIPSQLAILRCRSVQGNADSTSKAAEDDKAEEEDAESSNTSGEEEAVTRMLLSTICVNT